MVHSGLTQYLVLFEKLDRKQGGGAENGDLTGVTLLEQDTALCAFTLGFFTSKRIYFEWEEPQTNDFDCIKYEMRA